MADALEPPDGATGEAESTGDCVEVAVEDSAAGLFVGDGEAPVDNVAVGVSSARFDGVPVTVGVIDGEAPNDRLAVAVDEDVAVIDDDAVDDGETPTVRDDVAVSDGVCEGSASGGVREAVGSDDGDGEAPCESDEVADGADDVVAVPEAVMDAEEPCVAEDVPDCVDDVVASGVPAAEAETVRLPVGELVELAVPEEVRVAGAVIDAVTVGDRLWETVTFAVPDADAPAETVLVAVDVPVPVYEGVGAVEVDTDADRDAETERVSDADTEGDGDGDKHDTSVTEPAAPAEPAAPPPTYETVPNTVKGQVSLTHDAPPPPPAPR